jgi:hypothetical protein
MNIQASVQEQLQAVFAPLNTVAAAKAFPAPSTLSKTLGDLISKDAGARRNVDQKIASYFSTAAVDMWLRSVHSFLISASLTEASPIWASVTGYYSSHYAVRSLAHLLGHFQLFRRKRLVELRWERPHYVCLFKSKEAGDAEHKVYWKILKKSIAFQGDALFTENRADDEDSDARHRNHANYADHLGSYPMFRPLDEQALKDRIEYISKIVFDAPPLPRFSKFPDVEYVQLIAYHRLVRFRRLLDEVLGSKNRFWNVHRTPPFADGYVDFQLTESERLVTSGT